MFWANRPHDGFDTARDAFIGLYGAPSLPEAVQNGRCTNSVVHGWAPVGAMQFHMALRPGESRELFFGLGYVENPEDEKFSAPGVINKTRTHAMIGKYRTPAQFDAAMDALHGHWDTLLSNYHAETGDEKVDRMVNIWNQYQCMVTFNMSRSASYFESGMGRGMGFRDSCQDLLGFVHIIPERARERILDIAATQFADGSAYHQYQPLTKKGNLAVGSGFNDDPLWLIAGVDAYLRETGDWSPCYTFPEPHTLIWGDEMKKWVQIVLPVMLFATVLYFCVFAVVFYQSEQTAALLGSGTTVVLDAGHGGEDGGATGVSGTSEAALNLEISLRVRDLLRLCGVQVSMIRETDTAVYSDGCRTIAEKKVSDIKNRASTVNQTEQPLLLSIHQNFFTEGKYHGAQVFYAKTPGSQQLAEQLQSNLALGLEPDNHRQCKKSDGVYLMEHIDCTGVLVECGFLSNYEEEQRLLQPEYQKKLAAVIAGTLSVWLSEEHPNEI